VSYLIRASDFSTINSLTSHSFASSRTSTQTSSLSYLLQVECEVSKSKPKFGQNNSVPNAYPLYTHRCSISRSFFDEPLILWVLCSSMLIMLAETCQILSRSQCPNDFSLSKRLAQNTDTQYHNQQSNGDDN
jgi:hypothetical protein